VAFICLFLVVNMVKGDVMGSESRKLVDNIFKISLSTKKNGLKTTWTTLCLCCCVCFLTRYRTTPISLYRSLLVERNMLNPRCVYCLSAVDRPESNVPVSRADNKPLNAFFSLADVLYMSQGCWARWMVNCLCLKKHCFAGMRVERSRIKCLLF
jgi:hypothetical protein